MFCAWPGEGKIYAEGGGSLEPRTASIEGSFLAWGGLRKLDRGLALGEPIFPDSDSDSDDTFQITRKLGHEHIEFFCLLDSVQYCTKLLWLICQFKFSTYILLVIFQ